MFDLLPIQIIVVFAGLIAVFIRFYEIGAVRSSNATSSCSPIVFATIIHGLITWIIKLPLDWLSDLGWTPRLFIVLVAFWIGWGGLGDTALGFSAVHGLWKFDFCTMGFTPTSRSYYSPKIRERPFSEAFESL
jgi:hypothetical protein